MPPTLPIHAEIQTSADPDRLEFPAGSTAPALRVALTDAAGEPVTLHTVARVDIRLRRGRSVVLDEHAQLVDADAGEVEYQWRDGETDDPGTYRARFLVRRMDGTVLKCPSTDPLVVAVTP